MTEAVTTANRRAPIVIATVVVLLVALPGMLLTELGPWYRALLKPAWQPPDWLFGPAWTTIYVLTGTAAVMAWRATETRQHRQNLLILFMLNAFLNVLWSLLFFRLQRPDWALFEVTLLWTSIAFLLYACLRRRTLAAILLLPYLAWVSFAAVLNAEIVRLNAPFHTVAAR